MPNGSTPHPLGHARRCYAVHTAYGERLAAAIPDDRFAEVPLPGMNPPAWLLGHVAVVGNFALSRLAAAGADAEPVELPGWRGNFGIGSAPLVYADGFVPPTAAELRAAVRETHARVLAAAAAVPPDRLTEPTDPDRLADRFPTAGDLLTHLLTTHDAVHWGQLSAWRRAAGLPAV